METAYQTILDLYNGQHEGRQMMYHQIASYNHFIKHDLINTVESKSPVIVEGSPDLTLAGTTRAAAGTAGRGKSHANCSQRTTRCIAGHHVAPLASDRAMQHNNDNKLCLLRWQPLH
jgi:hypothetical protein